jgi:serine/threonine protein kinase
VSAFEPRRFGGYLLQSRLGRGGMAEVFLAQREGAAGFARTVVVKRILGSHQEDPSFVDMFINEAKIAAELTHPNIVQVYELGQVDGEFFIAMEYVRGHDLLRVLQRLAQARPSALPPAAAAFIARETCRALQHAHDHVDLEGRPQPIIHRDVSPQNIMISYDGQVKLVDFGIAKALGSMREETRTGALKGKFAYMAPEQIAGFSPSPQTDVFAVGVVLHEMLTGRRLFRGETDFDTLSKVKSMSVPAPSSLCAAVPAVLDDATACALARDRNTRYLRAGQMARDLDHYLQSVRFSVEDMAEFMTTTFSSETQGDEEKSNSDTVEQAVAPGRATPASIHLRPSDSGVHSRTNLGVVGATLSQQRDGARKTSRWVTALAASVGLSAVGMVLWKQPGGGRTRDVATVKELPSAAARLTIDVLLDSEPLGAQVYDGPRLVGTTPLSLRLPPGESGRPVTLVSGGRKDLTYTVRPGDAPRLTLRLEPLAPTTAHSPELVSSVEPPTLPLRTPPGPAASSVAKSKRPVLHRADERPKVEIFDDPPVASEPKFESTITVKDD